MCAHRLATQIVAKHANAFLKCIPDCGSHRIARIILNAFLK
jgi:hypothetical protein